MKVSAFRDKEHRAEGALPALSDTFVPIGLAGMLATLLIYSGAVTPFQRYELLVTFIHGMPRIALWSAFAASIAFMALSIGGKEPSNRTLAWGGGLAFAAGDVSFCLMALFGSPSAWFAAMASVVIGVGSCTACLAWGRVMRRCNLREATFQVALAIALATALDVAMYRLPAAAGIGVFLACIAFAVVIPAILLARTPTPAVRKPENEGLPPQTAKGRRAATRVGAFLSVAAAPAIGLLLFAFIMGVRGENVVEHYPYIVTGQMVVSVAILICTLSMKDRPLVQIVYQGLIPITAMGTVAVAGVSRLLENGIAAELFMVYLLCALAATLTIATLVGIAHADEFPSDLVFSMAVALHCLASRVGQRTSIALPDSTVAVGIAAAIAAYAMGMVICTVVKNLRAENDPFRELLDGLAGIAAVPGGGDAGHSGSQTALWSNLVSQRCEELADQCHLTGREREILGYLAEGRSGAYISDALLISPSTVRTHIHNIYQRLGVSSREEVFMLTRPQ